MSSDAYGYLPFEQGNLYEPYESSSAVEQWMRGTGSEAMKNTNSSLDANRMHSYAGWTDYRPPGWSQLVDARDSVTDTVSDTAGSASSSLWNRTGGALLSNIFTPLQQTAESGQKTIQAAILIPMIIVGVLVLAVGVVVIVKLAKKG